MEVKNGYFKLDIREMGAFLQIYPPENGGKQLEVKEVLEYLERKGYSGFQLKELNDAILSSTGTILASFPFMGGVPFAKIKSVQY